MIAVWALVAFVSVIIVWNAVLKRNIGEAMIVGFLAVGVFALFGGGVPGRDRARRSLDSMQEEVTFAGLAFVFMSYLLVKTPVLDRLIDLLNSVLGRLRGGPVYTATVAGGIFGAIAHVGAAVTAAVGSVTVPWMKRSGVSRQLAATIVAGGAGHGRHLPVLARPCSSWSAAWPRRASCSPTRSSCRSPSPGCGAWATAWCSRYYLVRADGIQPIAAEDRIPLGRSLRSGWTSLLLFVPILIPLLLTRGPIAAALGDYSGVGEMLKKPRQAGRRHQAARHGPTPCPT